MATKTVTLKGKARYCKPWPFQLDTVFATLDDGSPDPKGGNVAMDIALDEASEVVFKAMNAKAKIKEGFLKIRRYERHPKLGELGPVIVTGVDEGTLIGNDSDVTVTLEVYDYGDRFGKRAIRWKGLHVDNLVPFENADDKPRPAVNVPV